MAYFNWKYRIYFLCQHGVLSGGGGPDPPGGNSAVFNITFNPFTTIHDGNFRRHSSMYVTIHDGNFRRIYYSYTRIRGSWYAPRPGSEEVKNNARQQLRDSQLLFVDK